MSEHEHGPDDKFLGIKKAYWIVLLVIIAISAGILHEFSQQFREFLMVIRQNPQPLLAAGIIFLLWKMSK